jgi:hypothetical protein
MELAYEGFNGNVTNEMLNDVYGAAGMVFRSHAEAVKHKKIYGGYLCQLSDYNHSDVYPDYSIGERGNKIFNGVKVRDGAKRHTTGWLVTAK